MEDAPLKSEGTASARQTGTPRGRGDGAGAGAAAKKKKTCKAPSGGKEKEEEERKKEGAWRGPEAKRPAQCCRPLGAAGAASVAASAAAAAAVSPPPTLPVCCVAASCPAKACPLTPSMDAWWRALAASSAVSLPVALAALVALRAA